tara:strand:+ start:4310 stop:5623 length:1314 start_codon:yes stop_codon:yes gene_type:complete
MSAVAGKKHWSPNPDITKEELEEMRVDVLDRIIVARIGLLLRHPFFGNMATRLRIKSADDWCPTAAVDGKNLYFNTQFFNAMDNKEIEFVIAHEILHCVFDHLGRRAWQGRNLDPHISNIAQDYIVNNTLVRDSIGTKPKLVDCFQDFKYEDWTSEEVYEDIFQKYDEEELKALGELLDEHLDLDDDSGGGANKKDAEQDTNHDDGNTSAKAPKYSKEELKKIRDSVKEGMMQAAQAAGAGNLPKEVQRMISELTEPKMNWREIIRQQIQSTIRNDYTFSRPSRKGWHTGVVLPGMNFDEQIDLCIAFDMSGSIGGNMPRDFLSEVKGICDEFKEYNIKIWCFDTSVYAEQDFHSDQGDDISEYQPIGGGGTEFMVNWEYMKENDIVPKKFIMFTDGYPWGSWGEEDYCETVFVIHSNRKKDIQAPFGVTAHYEETV